MSVGCYFSLFSFAVILATVSSIQNQFLRPSNEPVCSYPYTCILTSHCAGRHSARGIEEVLFRCEEKNKVCCPPAKAAQDFPTETSNVSKSTTQRSVCAQCAYRPTGKPDAGGDDDEDHGEQRPSRRPLPQPRPAESRRPPQPLPPEDPRRPRPQTGQASQTRRPQTSSSNTLSQSQRPRYPQLSSHKNFHFLPNESHCGVNNFANRITEGEEVSLGEYPWMVLTGLKDRYGNSRWNCGGTLISGWYVLTAAHCLIVDNRTIEIVRLGEHSLTNETDCSRDLCLDPPEDVPIAEVIPHEKWNTTTIKNDIALLRLSRNPLKLGKSNIYPICLPLDVEKLNLTSSTKYEIAGWGKTDWNADEGSDVLRKASISGVNREECNICKDKKKQQYCPITDTQLCVQGWKSVDVCKGDSGGPLMVTRLNIYQIGITSFKGSEYCGAENIPSIFTRVESYLPWILDNIRQ